MVSSLRKLCETDPKLNTPESEFILSSRKYLKIYDEKQK